MKDKVVIIPVHNQLDYLKVALESVYEKQKDAKVIIVDDGSTDMATAEWIKLNKNVYFYDVVFHGKAFGFSKACNDGIELALEKYDFECLCLLNSDTKVVTNNWFDKVEAFFTANDGIGVASVMSDSALAQSVRSVTKYLVDMDKKPTVCTGLPHGFCYFISRKLIDEIGLLDVEMFPHYGSEDDYSLRSMERGYTNLLIGNVFVHHFESKSYSSEQRARIVQKSAPALGKKWGRAAVNRAGMLSVKAGNYINNH